MGGIRVVIKPYNIPIISLHMYFLNSYFHRRVFSLQLVIIPLRKAPGRVQLTVYQEKISEFMCAYTDICFPSHCPLLIPLRDSRIILLKATLKQHKGLIKTALIFNKPVKTLIQWFFITDLNFHLKEIFFFLYCF